MIVTIPLRLVSEANARDHWAKKAKRVKQQRGAVGLVVVGLLWRELGFPDGAWGAVCDQGRLDVHLTRLAPSGGLDGDNLVSSCKAVRDGVADALGVKDDDSRVTWHYDQRPSGKRGLWGVEIRIVAREAA